MKRDNGECVNCKNVRTCNSLDKSRGMPCKDFKKQKNSKTKRGTVDVDINDVSEEISGTRV